MFLYNTQEYYNWKNSFKFEMFKPISFNKFFEAQNTPFFQSTFGTKGYNHMFISYDRVLKIEDNKPSIYNISRKLTENAEKYETTYYKMGCYSGEKLTAINNIVVSITGDKNNIDKIFNAEQSNTILCPTYTIFGNKSRDIKLIYSLATPIILTNKNRELVMKNIEDLQLRLSDVFNLQHFGGHYYTVKDKNNKDIKVQTRNDAYPTCETMLNVNLEEIYQTGFMFNDILEFNSLLKKCKRAKRIGKKTLKSVDNLNYLYNEQKYIYHTTKQVDLSDKLALQCDNIYNKAILLEKVNSAKIYDLMTIYAVSLIKANRDTFYYNRMLISLFNVLNKKSLNKNKMSVLMLKDLLYLTDEEKQSIASNYSYEKDKHILVENGINVYEKEFNELRKNNYAVSKLNKTKPYYYSDLDLSYEKNCFSRKNRVIWSVFESKVGVNLIRFLIETNNFNLNGVRKIKREYAKKFGKGYGNDLFYRYKKEILEFFNCHKESLNKKEWLLKVLEKKHITALENKRYKRLKIRKFENEYELNLETLTNYSLVSNKYNKNIISTRKHKNVKVFYFLDKHIKVVYNYLADMCQVFHLSTEEMLLL